MKMLAIRAFRRCDAHMCVHIWKSMLLWTVRRPTSWLSSKIGKATKKLCNNITLMADTFHFQSILTMAYTIARLLLHFFRYLCFIAACNAEQRRKGHIKLACKESVAFILIIWQFQAFIRDVDRRHGLIPNDVTLTITRWPPWKAAADCSSYSWKVFVQKSEKCYYVFWLSLCPPHMHESLILSVSCFCLGNMKSIWKNVLVYVEDNRLMIAVMTKIRWVQDRYTLIREVTFLFLFLVIVTDAFWGVAGGRFSTWQCFILRGCFCNSFNDVTVSCIIVPCFVSLVGVKGLSLLFACLILWLALSRPFPWRREFLLACSSKRQCWLLFQHVYIKWSFRET